MEHNKITFIDILKKYGYKKVIVSSLVILFFAALIIVFYVMLYSAERDKIINVGKVNAMRYAQQLDKYMSKGCDVLDLTGSTIETMIKDDMSTEKIDSYLADETNVILSALIPEATEVYAYINGRFTAGSGWTPEAGFDPTTRPWYTSALLRKGEVAYVDPYIDVKTGEKIMTLAKSLGSTNDIIALDISLGSVQSMTEQDAGDKDDITEMVLDSGGAVIAHSDRNEINKDYSKEKNTLGAQIVNKLFSSDESTFELSFGGYDYMVYVMDIENNWYSVSAMESSRIFMPLRFLLLTAAITIILTIVSLGYIMLKSGSKELIADNLNVQLSSAANIYMAMADIDLITKSISIIKETNDLTASLPDDMNRNIQLTLNSIMDHLPESPTKQLAKEFVDLSTLEERLNGSNTITAEYLSFGDLWCRGRFVVSQRTSSGELSHVLLMAENIDLEKKERDKLLNEIEKLNGQLSCATDIYTSLCDLDLSNDTMIPLKNTNPAIARTISKYSHNIKQGFARIMKSLPENHTKQTAVEFADLSTLDERMKNKDTLTIEYLSYNNRWVRGRFVASERSKYGKLVHVLWMVEDIDAEKRMRDAMTDAMHKLNIQMTSVSNIYLSMHDIDIIHNTYSKIRTNAYAFAEYVGNENLPDAQKALAEAMKKLVNRSSLIKILEFINFSTLNVRLAVTNTITEEFLSCYQTWCRARFIVSERTPKGSLSHVIWLVEDIDLEKKNRDKLIDISERAIAASEAKSAFLSNMSHEIRTPINAMLGMNEMILRECDDKDILVYAESIRTAGNTLLGIISDILDFSKIEAGKMEIILVDYDLGSVLGGLVSMISTRAEDKGLILVTEFDRTTPGLLHGDEIRIKQIIMNILTNAVKYTEKGTVTFSLGYERIKDDPDSVMLNVSIRDTGIGIKDEDMKKLFREFERIDEKHNRSIEGTGLGMSITQSLLSMMGSRLKVESVYGKGSTFSFSVKQGVRKWEPLGDYEAAYNQSIIEREKYRERFVAPDARLLVVDDTPMNLLVFRSLLKKTGIKIDCAGSGSEGIALALTNKYDIIFLDHMMPEKDGIETLAELKAAENNPNAATVTICLTANAVSGARETYISAGFDDYLSKPIDPAKLEDMIMSYLPDDKIRRCENTPAQDDEDEGGIVPAFVFDIGEIDAAAGIQYSGSEELYLETLKAYAEMIPDHVRDTRRFYESGDIVNATIKIHALKSTSRVIGATDISDLALKLENAGNENDTELLGKELPGLLDRCLRVSEQLMPLCDMQEEALPMITDDELEDAYALLREFSANGDSDGVRDIIAGLSEYTLPDEEKERFKALVRAEENGDLGAISDILP